MRANRSFVNLGFTFDLFVCVAILVMNSDAISVGTDAASVYGTLNRSVPNIMFAGWIAKVLISSLRDSMSAPAYS